MDVMEFKLNFITYFNFEFWLEQKKKLFNNITFVKGLLIFIIIFFIFQKASNGGLLDTFRKHSKKNLIIFIFFTIQGHLKFMGLLLHANVVQSIWCF